MVYETRLYLETTDLFAWTAAVVLLSLLVEKGVRALVRRRERRVPGPLSKMAAPHL